MSNSYKILQILPTFKNGLTAPLKDLSQNHLNHVFADHKMTIGQLAVHSSAWAVYFLTEPKPWKIGKGRDRWTCIKCKYPLTMDFVLNMIARGFTSIEGTLINSDDIQLEVKNDNSKGPGYIILRLLHHVLVHSNQMAYLRQLLDSDWDFGSNFGDMATALIGLDYHTTRDSSVQGF